MGEIGISPDQFYYELRWWEMKAILNGYNLRHRDYWSGTRWQTFYLMKAFGADLGKAGIHQPKDLLSLPWDNDMQPAPVYSDEEERQLQEEMRLWNEEHQQPQAETPPQ